jgi:hypothetical protein
VPTWAWLVALVAVSTVVRYGFARRNVAPWIMIDEIVYSELAKSFAATGHFAVRGVPTSGYGLAYPVLISPAYQLFDALPTAYAAVKAINSLAISLAAVPAYLLARRAVEPGLALLVALLTVAVPSAFYAAVVMTENAFYALFLLAALALVAALERPTPLRVLLLLGAIGLAYATRAQAIALVPAALTAPLFFGFRRLARFAWLYGVLLAVSALAVAWELGRGRSLRSLLGAYAAATNESYSVHAIAKWLLWHLGELDLYVGVVPVVAAVVLVRLLPRLEDAERAVVAATIALVGWFAVEVAAFATQPSVSRLEERNLFYVAPLLFACLAVWLQRRLPRPRITVALGAVGAVLLAVSVPYGRFVGVAETADALMTLPLWSLSNWFAIPLDDLRWIVGGVALLLAAAAVFVPVRARLVLPLLVLALYVAVAQPVDARTRKAAIGALFQGIGNPDRDWVDAAVGRKSNVAMLWSGLNDRLTVNENEFFNRSVGDVYYLREPVPGNLAETAVAVDRRTGNLIDPQRRPVDVAFVVADTSLPLAGSVVARDKLKGLRVLGVDGPLRVRYVTSGIYGDSWTGPTFTYSGFDCGRSVRVRLGSDPGLFRRVQVVRAYVGGRFASAAGIRPAGETTLYVPVPRGKCRVVFRVARTEVPARVHKGSDDTRRLGVRVLRFEP